MEFNQSILTQKGRTLMAKAISGRANIVFTKMQSSSTQYQMTQLEMLTSLSDVKQRADVVAEKNNGVTVKVKGTFDNYNLNSGYDFRTVGLYANDPDEGEILYSVSTASVSGYMPPNTGISATGIDITFYVEVGNADKVNLEIDPAGFATKAELRALEINVAYANSSDGSVDFTRIKPNENLWEQSKTVNGWFEDDGTLTNAQSSSQHKLYPEYIRVNPNDIYYLTFINPNSVVNKNNSNKIIFLDENKRLIDKIWVMLTEKIVRQIKIPVPSNARYMRVGVIQGVDSYDSSIKIKLEKSDTPTTYLSSKYDNYRDSFMKYIGYSVKNSTNPSDYRWQVNPEWQRAQSEYEKATMIHDNLDKSVNLITNGDFSNALTGWELDVFGKIENYQNKLKFSTDSTQGNHAIRTNFSESLKKNHKYYLKFDLDMSDGYLNTADFYFEKAGGYFDKIIQIENNRSFLIDLTVDADMLHFATRGTSVGYVLLDNVRLYDLTTIFGVGNEPTKDEMDRLLTINVNSLTIYSQSIAQAKLNAHPINSLYYTESAESPVTTFGGKWTKLGTEAKFSKTFNVWQRTQ